MRTLKGWVWGAAGIGFIALSSHAQDCDNNGTPDVCDPGATLITFSTRGFGSPRQLNGDARMSSPFNGHIILASKSGFFDQTGSVVFTQAFRPRAPFAISATCRIDDVVGGGGDGLSLAIIDACIHPTTVVFGGLAPTSSTYTYIVASIFSNYMGLQVGITGYFGPPPSFDLNGPATFTIGLTYDGAVLSATIQEEGGALEPIFSVPVDPADMPQFAYLGLGADTFTQGLVNSGQTFRVYSVSGTFQQPIVDCNSNGIEDACDIVTGTSLDTNSNGVPDECDPAVVRVPQDEPTICAAATLVRPGGEILVSPGIHAITCNVILPSKPITIRSTDGPSVTFIDTSLFGVQNYGPLVVEGISFVNGAPDPYFNSHAPLELRNCVLDGGGVVSTDAVTMIDTFVGNSGVGLNCAGDVTVERCTFDNCVPAILVAAIGDDTISITDSFFTGNDSGSVLRSPGSGGAISLTLDPSSNATINIAGCEFIGNTATQDGGAILIERPAGAGAPSLHVTDCTFEENTAGGLGTAAYVFGVPAHVSGCDFVRNDGGATGLNALYLDPGGDSAMVNCSFVGNKRQALNFSAPAGAAASMANSIFIGNLNAPGQDIQLTGPITVSNCAFIDNAGPVGVRLVDGPVLSSSIVRGGATTQIQISGTATVEYNDVEGGFAGAGNFDADPMFVRDPDPGPDTVWGTLDDDYGDLRLRSGSPCRDAGDNTGVAPDDLDLDGDMNLTEPVPFDLAGDARFVDDPSVPDTGVGPPPVVDIGPYEAQDASLCSPADLTTQGAGAGDPLFGEPDGLVTAADINYFVNAWVAGDLAIADVTTQGAGAGDPGFGVPDGTVTGADIQYYVNLWVAGCP